MQFADAELSKQNYIKCKHNRDEFHCISHSNVNNLTGGDARRGVDAARGVQESESIKL